MSVPYDQIGDDKKELKPVTDYLPASPVSTPAQSQQNWNDDDVNRLLDAMHDGEFHQESTNNYQVGNNPRTGATGGFQVLPTNIPDWTQKYVGRPMSQEEFKNDSTAQETVFRGEMGKYIRAALQKSGGDRAKAMRMAAAAWYGGEGAMDRFDDPKRFRPNEPSFQEYTSGVADKANASMVNSYLGDTSQQPDVTSYLGDQGPQKPVVPGQPAGPGPTNPNGQTLRSPVPDPNAVPQQPVTTDQPVNEQPDQNYMQQAGIIASPEQTKQQMLAQRQKTVDDLNRAKTPARRNILLKRIKDIDDQLLKNEQQIRANQNINPETLNAPESAPQPGISGNADDMVKISEAAKAGQKYGESQPERQAKPQPAGQPQKPTAQPPGRYPFEKNGSLTLSNGQKMKYLGRDGLTDGQYRFQDDDGATYVWDRNNNKAGLQAEKPAPPADEFDVNLLPESEKYRATPEVGQGVIRGQVAQHFLDKFQIPKSDTEEFYRQKGFRDLTSGQQIDDPNRFVGSADKPTERFAVTKTELKQVQDFSQKRRKSLEDEALATIASGAEISPELKQYYKENDLDVDQLESTRYGDYKMAQAKAEVARKDLDKYVEELKSGVDSPTTRSLKKALDSYNLSPSDETAARIVAARRVGSLGEQQMRNALANYSQARENIRTELRDAKKSFSDQMGGPQVDDKASIAAGQPVYQSQDVSDAEVDQAIAEAKKIALSPAEKQQAILAGRAKQQQLGSVPFIGDYLAAFATSAPSGVSGLLKTVAGAARVASMFGSEADQRDYVGLAKLAQRIDLETSQVGNQAPYTKAGGQIVGGLPELIALGKTKLGLAGSFAFSDAAKSLGSGEMPIQAAQKGEKGYATGAAFQLAEPVASTVMRGLFGKLAPNILGTTQPAADAAKSTAAIGELPGETTAAPNSWINRVLPQFLTPETQAELRDPAILKELSEAHRLGMDDLLNPDLRRILTTAKVIKEGVRLGTIAAGTGLIEAKDTDNARDVVNAAVQNVVMDAVMTHADAVGDTFEKALDSFKGRVFDVRTENGMKTVTIDNDGSLITWDKMPDAFKDGTLYAKDVTPKQTPAPAAPAETDDDIRKRYESLGFSGDALEEQVRNVRDAQKFTEQSNNPEPAQPADTRTAKQRADAFIPKLTPDEEAELTKPVDSGLKAENASNTVTGKDGKSYEVLEDQGNKLKVQEVKPDGSKGSITLQGSRKFTDLEDYRNNATTISEPSAPVEPPANVPATEAAQPAPAAPPKPVKPPVTQGIQLEERQNGDSAAPAPAAPIEPQTGQPKFDGRLEAGEFDKKGREVLGNFNRMKDANALAKEKNGVVVPYLGGKYKTGWYVADRGELTRVKDGNYVNFQDNGKTRHEAVEANPVTIPGLEDYDLFERKEDDGTHVITEASTGMKLAHGTTAERARELAAEIAQKYGPEGVREVVQTARDKFGLTPNYEYRGRNASIDATTAAIGQAVTGTAPAHDAATSPHNELPEPTLPQKEAGNYQKGHIKIGGLDISVENPVGSQRSGVDRDGKPWSVTMQHHYGYIRGSIGADKEHIDTFVKDNTPSDYSGPVFVVDQVHPDTGRFDEHKVMIGFDSEQAARDAYMSNYAKGWKGLKSVTEMPMDQFKSWATDAERSRPVGATIPANDRSSNQPETSSGNGTKPAEADTGAPAGTEAKGGQNAPEAKPDTAGEVTKSTSDLFREKLAKLKAEQQPAEPEENDPFDDIDDIMGFKSVIEPAFDQDKYDKLKPAFEKALATFEAKSPDDAMEQFLRKLNERYDLDKISQLEPFIVKFMDEQQPAAATEAEKPAEVLKPGTQDLITDIAGRLNQNKSISWQELDRMADAAFGGSRAAGRYEPKDMYDAMEAAVVRHLNNFDHEYKLSDDPKYAHAVLAKLRKLIDLLPTQRTRTEEQIKFQQFSTPPTIAYTAAVAAAFDKSDVVVEPSAGTGMLAVWPHNAGVAELDVNEIAPRRRALLEALGIADKVTSVDAQFLNSLLPADIKPTVFLMNPPFSATGGRTKANKTEYGNEHITQALARLQDGGRLVAIVGESLNFNRSTQLNFWRKTMSRYNVRANIAIPGQEYQSYGTNFGTQLVVIDKTGPTPGADFAKQLESVASGSPANLEGVLDAVIPIAKTRIVTGTDLEGSSGNSRPGTSGPSDADAGGNANEGGRRPVNAAGKTPSDGTAKGTATTPRPESGSELQQPAESDTATETEGTERGTGSVQRDLGQAGISYEGDNERRENDDATFVRYRPAKLQGGVPHPANIVESASMAAVDPPDIHYTPQIDTKVIKSGALSDLQLERVIYAGQRHEMRLPDGNRAGYFAGDGTGVGKSRMGAGIALDNWNQGRRRILMLSVNYDLLPSTKEAISALGGSIPVKSMNRIKSGASIDMAERAGKKSQGQAAGKDGVLFTSYATLIKEPRFAAIVDWLGKDGVIIFDEAHRAKNAVASGRGKASQTAQRVLDLQSGERSSPDSRITYMSATGATDVRNMAYMTRLGLWGTGTAFPTFQAFQAAIEMGGVGAMEMVSRDMKAAGMYGAVQISMRGVTYRELEHKVLPEQEKLYNLSARAWQSVLQNIDEAIKDSGASSQARAMAMQAFYGSQQRFFRMLLTALKVPTLIEDIERTMRDGSTYIDPNTGEERKERASIIVKLIGTSESRTKEEVTRALAEGRSFDDLDFSPKGIITSMVQRAFPTDVWTDATNDAGETIRVRVLNEDGTPAQDPELVAKREALLRGLEKLVLPESPLDQIIGYFGPDKVAEITGREKRLVRDPDTGETKYVKRAEQGVSSEMASQHEMDSFQDGRKRIAVISEAAGTGISLHAANDRKNKDRRVFYTLETGWSADQELQAMGRPHRTNQRIEPEMALLATNIGGEKRFLSTIAKRLASLGALTRGDRAASGGNLAKFDFESTYGDAAARSVVGRIAAGGVPEGWGPFDIEGEKIDYTPMQVLAQMGIAVRNAADELEVPNKAIDDMIVGRLLNRVLALEVPVQNFVFNHFVDTLERIIEAEKAAGKFDEGVSDIKGQNIRMAAEPKTVAQDPASGAKTEYYQLDADEPTKPVAFADLPFTEDSGATGQSNRFYQQKRSKNIIFVRETSGITDASTGAVHHNFRVTRPSGKSFALVSNDDLNEKYEEVNALQNVDVEPATKDKPNPRRMTVEDWWNEQYAATPKFATERYHIIGGALLPVWDRLRGVVASEGHPIKVVRAETEDGNRIVGVRVPENRIATLLRHLGAGESPQSAEDVFDAVWNAGQEVTLAGNITLKRSRLRGAQAIVVQGAPHSVIADAANLGLISELINYRTTLFVPSDKDAGIAALEKLLARHPVIEEDTDEPDSMKSIVETVPNAFYSRLEKTIDDKMPNRARAKTIQGIVKNTQGMKADDPEWQMLNVWLADQKGPVSKTGVLQFIQANQVQVQSTVMGASEQPNLQWSKDDSKVSADDLTFARDSYFDYDNKDDAITDSWTARVHEKYYISEYRIVRDTNDLYYVFDSEGREVPAADGTAHYSLSDGKDAANQAVAETEADDTRFSAWTLPGEQSNYREEFVTAPAGRKAREVLGEEQYMKASTPLRDALATNGSGQFIGWKDGHAEYADIANPIVRIRYNDRMTPDGQSMLFAEEIQQPGEGNFEKMPKVYQKYGELIGIKKLLYRAAAGDYHMLGLTTGEQQADRYSLAKVVDKINFTTNLSGQKQVKMFPRGSKDDLHFMVNSSGNVFNANHKDFEGKALAQVVGKSVAKQILDERSGDIEGEGLKVGGQDLARRYDVKYVDMVNKYLKPWGVKVESTEIQTRPEKHGFVLNHDGNFDSYHNTREAAEAYINRRPAYGRELWSIEPTTDPATVEKIYTVRITPEMQRAFLHDAQPLFRKGSREGLSDTEQLTFDQMQRLPQESFDKLLTPGRADLLRTGDRIRINAVSHEIYRRALEQLRIDGGKATVGSKKDAEDLFEGAFKNPVTVERVVQKLRQTAAEASSKGYTPGEVNVLKQHADELENAAKADEGTAILFVFDRALPEEVFHQADYLGAGDKSILNRHSDAEKAILDRHKVTSEMWKRYYSKINEYKRIKSNAVLKAVMRAEIAPHLLELNTDELATLGLTPQDKADYLYHWFKGYAEKNGMDSLDRFEKEELDVQTFTQKVKAAHSGDAAPAAGRNADGQSAANGDLRQGGTADTGEPEPDRSAEARPDGSNSGQNGRPVTRIEVADDTPPAPEDIRYDREDGTSVTGIRNSLVDEQRARRGLPPAMEPLRRAWGTVWNEVLSELDDHPDAALDLIAELRDNPRPLLDREDAMLAHHQVTLQNEHDRILNELITADDDPDKLASISAREAAVADALQEAYDISKRAGTLNAQGLAARAMLIKEDYSLSRMVLRKRAALGGRELTNGEVERLHELQTKIAETQKAFDDYISQSAERIAELQAQRAIEAMVSPHILQIAQKLVNKLDEKAETARQRLRSRGIMMSAGLSPIDLRDLAIVGASHLAHAGLDFATWSGRMTKEFGQGISTHLEKIFSSSQKLVANANVPKEREPREKLTTTERLEKSIKAGKNDRVYGLVQKLAREFIEQGIVDRDELINEIHGVLSSFDPTITRRDTMDAISGYGRYQQLSKDEIDVTLRDLKGQMQQVGKLEDMAGGEAPKKTGMERRTPSDEERRLIKQVEEAKRQGGYTVTDPATQLRTSLQAVKTRLANQIKDLEHQIATRQKIVKNRNKLPYDQEANMLVMRRNELRDQFYSIFGKPGLTDEQRLAAWKTRTANRIKDLEDRLKNKNFAPRPKRAPVQLDSEGMKLQADAERLKNEYQTEVVKDRLARRSFGEKAADAFTEYTRAAVLSSPAVFVKLLTAAAYRSVFTPMEEAAGSLFSAVIPGIAKRAPRQGGLNAKAEAKAFMAIFSPGIKDAYSKLTTGHSDLDMIYGKEKIHANIIPLLPYIGYAHGAMKAPIHRSEFERSLEKRIVHAIANGVDPTDPLVLMRLGHEAYEDAQRAIFQQNNFATDAYRWAMRRLEMNVKKTGRPTVLGKALGTALRAGPLRIVKVPTNIVGEALEYATGLATGSVRAGRAFYNGVEHLEPEEADLIMRHLKKGLLGAAALALGYFLADMIGGYYQPNEKRKPTDVGPGSVRLFDTDIPSWLLHNPLLELLQVGATIRRVSESYLPGAKDEQGNKVEAGMTNGVIAAGFGLVEETPFINQMLEFDKLRDPAKRDEFLGSMARDILVPQLSQWAAARLDRNDDNKPIKRKPESFGQSLELGIPVLRQRVPEKKPTKNMTLDAAENLYKTAGSETRKELLDIMGNKMKAADKKGKLDPQQAERLREDGAEIPGYVEMPADVKAEFDRFKIPVPDVGHSLSPRKDQKQKLTAGEYEEYRTNTLTAIYTNVQKLLQSDFYKRADPRQKEDMLQRTIKRSRMLQTTHEKREIRPQLPPDVVQ